MAELPPLQAETEAAVAVVVAEIAAPPQRVALELAAKERMGLPHLMQ